MLTPDTQRVTLEEIEQTIHAAASDHYKYDCGGRCHLIARSVHSAYDIGRKPHDRPRDLELTDPDELAYPERVASQLREER
jgi:hypothetical protein